MHQSMDRMMWILFLFIYSLFSISDCSFPKIINRFDQRNSLIRSTVPTCSFSFQIIHRKNESNPIEGDPLQNFWKRQSNTAKRRLEFWKRAGQIYTSYKLFQTKQFLRRTLPFLRKKGENTTEAIEQAWKALHDLNSQRMLNLSLSLRGFYLKSGQFLGTRHDFMPPEYITKLSKLHDDVPPMNASEVQEIIERELKGKLSDYFTSINLEHPIGSASIAQVHYGIWKKTNEKVAVKVQNRFAKGLMTDDLRNLGILAEFLQRTELKFDIVSAVKELRAQIQNEFDFRREAKHMDYIGSLLMAKIPNLLVPKAIFSSERLLVMSFIEGDNLSKYGNGGSGGGDRSRLSVKGKSFILKRFGKELLNTLADIWGYQIFEFNLFHADPHPGNICIQLPSRKIGLLDWGQMKSLPTQLQYKFSQLITALATHNSSLIVERFHVLGIKVAYPQDDATVEGLAITLFDTVNHPKYILSPFSEDAIVKKNPILSIPTDLYFIVRTVQLLRGITSSLGIHDFSLAEKWAPYANQVLCPTKS